MPTLAELRDGVYRDLADEANAVFSSLQVDDFVRGGLAELNRVAPVDTIYDLPLNLDPDTGLGIAPFAYDTPIELLYQCDVIRLVDDASWNLMEPVDGYVGSSGFRWRRTSGGGTITFPNWYLTQFDGSNYSIRLFGYAPRPLPVSVDETVNPSPAVDLSDQEEYSVRGYAKSAGFDMLSHDRSLFAQWQGQTNNTDVSPTQMLQMATNAKADWERQRSQIRTVRKYI